LPETELLERAKQFYLHGISYKDVNKALKAAIANASRDDMIVVCGSVFVVGEVEADVYRQAIKDRPVATDDVALTVDY
jgi:dihydrofolate synthase/folylpolyglutamate synthase